MTEAPKQSRIILFFQVIAEKLSHPRLYYFLATCVMIIGGLSWVISQWQNTSPFLQKTVPIWIVLLIVCPLFIIALIVNSKNKSLKKELKCQSESLKSFTHKPKKETVTFTNSDSVNIALGMQVSSTIEPNGWYYLSEDVVCIEHQRTLNPDNYLKPYEYRCREPGCMTTIRAELVNRAKREVKDLSESYIRKNFNIEPVKPASSAVY